MNKRIVILQGQSQRDIAARLAQDAPQGSMVTFADAKRKEIQSAKFHAMISDVSKQAKYQGRELTKDQWKVLFISGHAIATGGQADIIPGMEGEYVNIRESSAQMSGKRISSVIEYVYAWASNQEPVIRWSA